MGNTTTYGDIGQRTAAYAAREMLKHAEPKLVLVKMGASKPVPKNKAKTVKFRRPKPFPVSTVPLAEGVTPTPQKLQYEDVEATLKQYGNVSEISDVVIDTSEDPVLNDAAMLTGEQAGATQEQVTYAVVKGGTNVFYANGANRAAVNTPISLNKQRAVVRQLNAQKAQKIARILDGSPDYGTSPVEAAFVAVTHTDVEADIRNMAGFVPVSKYGTRNLVSEHEIGMVENVRYVLSEDLAPYLDAGGAPSTTVVSNGGSAADVYPILYFGRDSFGVVPLKGADAITPIVINPKPAPGDPLGQRGYAGYKFMMTAVILNELWMCRLEVAVSKL